MRRTKAEYAKYLKQHGLTVEGDESWYELTEATGYMRATEKAHPNLRCELTNGSAARTVRTLK